MKWRDLAPNETKILRKMLSQDFPGRNEMASQIERAQARQIDEEGSLEFKVPPEPRIETKHRIPVEAECADIDGVRVHFLLHVVDGRIKELEIYKEDSSPLFSRPCPDRLEVIALT